MSEKGYFDREIRKPERISNHALIYETKDGRKFVVAGTESENKIGASGPEKPDTQSFWEIDESGALIGDGVRFEIAFGKDGEPIFVQDDGKPIAPLRDKEGDLLHFRDFTADS